MKIDWKKKLSSRKFWLALVGFITPVLVMCNVDTETIEMVSLVIMSGASLIAYILAEGFIDAKREESYKYVENYSTKEEIKY